MDDAYFLAETVPGVDDYLRLRRIAGLTQRSETAASAGLPRTVASVVIRFADQAVGMGRAVGDGLFYQIVDMAVDPAHQGRGLGSKIMKSLLEQLERQAPAEVYVSLIADGDANRLYARHGFVPTAPASIGMAQWIGRREDE